MKRIILFRFHKSTIICKNRLRLLRLFNPGVKIYGLFGGRTREFSEFERKLSPELEHVYGLTGKSNYWKWKNGDFCVKLWYQDFGRTLDFDVLHVVEWDMLLFASLTELYGAVPDKSVGLSGLTLLKQVEDRWSWTTDEPYKSECLQLFALARDTFCYDLEPYVCIAGGACFPKSFLEKYANLDLPELGNDEVRMPLAAQILGFELSDTGFFKWYDKAEDKLFSVGDFGEHEIKRHAIEKEVFKQGGRRIFHPHRKVFHFTALSSTRWYNGYRSIINLIKKTPFKSLFKSSK